MDAIEQYKELQEKVAKARQKADKASGALEQIKSQIKDEFGCKSLKDAKVLLADLKQAGDALEQELQEAIEEFEREFGEQLKELSQDAE